MHNHAKSGYQLVWWKGEERSALRLVRAQRATHSTHFCFFCFFFFLIKKENRLLLQSVTRCCSFCARTGCGHNRCCTGTRSHLLWPGWCSYGGCLRSSPRDLLSPRASLRGLSPVLQSAYSSLPLSTTSTGLSFPRMTCLSITTSTFSRQTRFSATRWETIRRCRTSYSLASRCWTTATCTRGSATGPCWNVYGAPML